ncbi:hypothetical protein HYQ46_003969 [Verticillium longisporum]|nr:hypothetical protein HYQ46_003969 [Verticillium longisporum]
MGLSPGCRGTTPGCTKTADVHCLQILPEEKDSLQWLSERAGRQMRELQQDEPGVHLPTCAEFHPARRSMGRMANPFRRARCRLTNTPSSRTLLAPAATAIIRNLWLLQRLRIHRTTRIAGPIGVGRESQMKGTNYDHHRQIQPPAMTLDGDPLQRPTRTTAARGATCPIRRATADHSTPEAHPLAKTDWTSIYSDHSVDMYAKKKRSAGQARTSFGSNSTVKITSFSAVFSFICIYFICVEGLTEAQNRVCGFDRSERMCSRSRSVPYFDLS